MIDRLQELEAEYEGCDCSADIKTILCDYCAEMERQEEDDD